MIIIHLMLIMASLVASDARVGKMSGVHLRIAAVESLETFVIIRDPNNGTSRYLGIVPKVIELISERLNFTYSYVEIPKQLARSLGPTNSTFSYLSQGKVDLVSAISAPTVERLKIADFTKPVLIDGYTIVQPMPKIENPLTAIIAPFRPLVWLLTFLTLTAVVATLTILGRFQGGGRSRTDTNIIYVLVVLLGQGGEMSSKRSALRIVAGAFCLMAVVLANSYNGVLRSRLSTPKYEATVNSLEELSESELGVVLMKGTAMTNIFLNAQSGSSRKLGDHLRANPRNMLQSEAEVNERLLSGCCAYPIPTVLARIIVSSTMTPDGSCRLTMGKQINFYQMFSLAATKGSPWLREMDHEINLLWSNGILSNWIGQLGRSKHIEKCTSERIKIEKDHPLSLETLSSAFVILLSGTLLSMAAFTIEIRQSILHSVLTVIGEISRKMRLVSVFMFGIWPRIRATNKFKRRKKIIVCTVNAI